MLTETLLGANTGNSLHTNILLKHECSSKTKADNPKTYLPQNGSGVCYLYKLELCLTKLVKFYATDL